MSENQPLEALSTPAPEQQTREEQKIIHTDEDIPLNRIDSEQSTTYGVHQNSEDGTIIAPVGDYAHVGDKAHNIIHNTYNYQFGLLKEIEQDLSAEEDEENGQGSYNASDIQSFLKYTLRFEQRYTPRFDDQKSEKQNSDVQLPADEEQLSNWYYQRDDYEQCYVQSVAILHGATVQEIYRHTDILYRILLEQKNMSFSPLSSSSPKDLAINKENFTFPRQPSLRLQQQMQTITRRVKGQERLFWRDIDEYGVSIYGSHVLVFLAKEFMSKGEHWQQFKDTIIKWTSERGDCSWRAARALGVILWQQNISLLSGQAGEWAKAKTFKGGRLASSMLAGAREIERIISHNQTYDTHSYVFQLLSEWTDKIFEKPVSLRTNETVTKTNISLGCAAANAYALIGKDIHDTEQALSGLKNILKLRQKIDIDEISKVRVAIKSAYVSLTWAGHIRLVLQDLAALIEEWVHLYGHPKLLVDRPLSRVQREIRMDTTFETFFLVVMAAASESRTTAPATYKEIFPLDTQIPMPDQQERDIVLSGILTGDVMRTPVCILFCAAIISQHSKLAFEHLQRWAIIIVSWQIDQNDIAQSLYDRFIGFLVELGRTIAIWSNDFENQHYRIPAAKEVFKYSLEQWSYTGHTNVSLRKMVKKVLKQLASDRAIYL